MKKLLTLLAIATLVTATNITPTQSALCVQPKGQLQGTINQLEAQGYSLATIECTTINYWNWTMLFLRISVFHCWGSCCK